MSEGVCVPDEAALLPIAVPVIRNAADGPSPSPTARLDLNTSPKLIRALTLLGLIVLTAACEESDLGAVSTDTGIDTPSGSSTDGGGIEEEIDRENSTWTTASHENGTDPEFDIVFPDDTVLRMDITISAENWAIMQADLDANMGSSVGGPGGGGPGGGGPGGGGPGGGAELDFTPVWSEATIEFNGAVWNHVGIRFKGNSTLNFAHQAGEKYPLKLDFDEWEDDYPSVDDQRFYGFKQLNLSSNYDDSSFMREKVSSDLFRAFGVPSAHAAFCEVYLDVGNGPEFAGVYTLVEEVDDTVYENQFVTDEGNLYKPDGDAASFAEGTFDTAEMDLKTNEDEADYSDVTALYDVLHDDRRTTDEEAWMSALEDVFNVDHFLRYLAVNQVIQNWDTYGMMTHNFFLYQDEGTLNWIPWDNNESMTEGRRQPLSLSLAEVGDDWPLIRYIIDVEFYEARYVELMQEFVANHFNAANMEAIYDTHEAILQDVALMETNQFTAAVEELRSHAASREAAVDAL